MATYTSKLNLKKSLGTEHVSRSDMNDNYDKIDAGVVLNTDGEISNSLTIGSRKSGVTVGTRSVSIGINNRASASGSFAQGNASYATGNYSHAVNSSVAGGNYSHSEGYGSGTHGDYSHAEGYNTYAYGNNAHTEGVNSIANSRSQHIGGENNVQDTTGGATIRGTYAEIIGNGTATDARSNARALDWDGNEYLMGDLYVGCDADSTGGEKVTTDPFTGATSSAAGSKGYVPAPSAGDQTKFLRADGTWGNVDGASDMIGATASTAGEHGLVPAPAAGDQTKFLSGAGTWEPVGGASDMTGATASTAGVHGLVPAPAAGDQNKVLTGAGTWSDFVSKKVMKVDSILTIGSGITITMTMDGITADHELWRWNFFDAATNGNPIPENAPPQSMEWTTSAGGFTITNNGSDTVYCQPVFVLPDEFTATAVVSE